MENRKDEEPRVYKCDIIGPTMLISDVLERWEQLRDLGIFIAHEDEQDED